MNYKQLFRRPLIAIAILTQSAALAASSDKEAGHWVLDAELSSFTFASVKNDTIAEVHSFSGLSASVNPETGIAVLEIETDTVESGIDIRNQRMKTHLFHTGTHKLATASAEVPANIWTLNIGETIQAELDVEVTIVGIAVPIYVDVDVTHMADHSVVVTPAKQVMLSAGNWALDQGIGKLRSIAGLDSIDLISPVTFRLVFKPQ